MVLDEGPFGKIVLRSYTLQSWQQLDPILRNHELVYELDSRRFKIGNGVQEYTQLPYILGTTGEQGFRGFQGIQGIEGRGFQGIQGVDGLQGFYGFQGVQGYKGVIGDQGIR